MQIKADIDRAIELKYPEQVVLVTTRSSEGRSNVMAVGWVSVASSEPLMFVLGIDDEAYTYKLITQTKEFVVAFPNENMAKEVLYAGSVHGHNRDKIKEAGLATQEPVIVKAPLIADAVANFECELVEITRPGDCPLIVGKVVAAHVNKDSSLRRLYTVGKAHQLAGVRPFYPSR
jgi:flavin reductase (DIM6/NTAB) family NADH-FMN oxidoreductase RutF